MNAPPRIFGIVAARADVVAVLRRGPTEWWHVGRWDTEDHTFEAGAWFHGQLYPQKCDLSPDGQWLLVSAMKPGANWAAGEIYEAVSELPWLQAVAAWEAGTTYSRGYHFTEDRTSTVGDPDVGDASGVLAHFGVAATEPVQFAVERRRDWEEDPERSEPQRDPWDESRTVTMRKAQPHGDAQLLVSGSYAAFRSIPHLRSPATYAVITNGREEGLADLQWADWAHDGSLLGATVDGHLVRSEGEGLASAWSTVADLATLRPDPKPPPAATRM